MISRLLIVAVLALTGEGLLWPDALVPFSIEEDYFDADLVHRIREEMNEWEQGTCVRFVPFIDQPDHVTVTQSKTG